MYYLDSNNYWRDDLDDRPVMVSIRCITYNHEKFIRDALEGFVNQKTNFRYEAIVHDDASTDGTAAIIKEYAEKYPSIIKSIFESENQYSKHDGSLGRIMNAHLRGKYVAMCEGDDYWTDPYKLQKQVDFLESHPDYSMCFHNCLTHWEDEKLDDKIIYSVEDRDYSMSEVYHSYNVPTASMVLKREVIFNKALLDAQNSKRFKFGDLLLNLAASQMGHIRGITDTMCVYRKHKNGASYTILSDELELANSHRWLQKYFGPQVHNIVAKDIIMIFRNATLEAIKKQNYSLALKALKYSVSFDFFKTIKSYALYVTKKVRLN